MPSFSFSFLPNPLPLAYILKLRDYEKDGNKAKANTRSRGEESLAPFPVVEKNVSSPLGNEKGTICSSMTWHLSHEFHPPSAVNCTNNYIEPKKTRPNTCSHRSLVVSWGGKLSITSWLFHSMHVCFQQLISTLSLDELTCQVEFTQLIFPGSCKSCPRTVTMPGFYA